MKYAKLIGALVCSVVLAGCDTPSPEAQALAKQNRQIVSKTVANEYIPLVPQIASACTDRIEGKPTSFAFLSEAGFQKKRALGRDFYVKTWTVGDQKESVMVRLPERGCSFVMPTSGSVNPDENRAKFLAEAKQRGYSVSAVNDPSEQELKANALVTSFLIGSSINSVRKQTATKGGTTIGMKSVLTRSDYGTGWEEYFVKVASE